MEGGQGGSWDNSNSIINKIYFLKRMYILSYVTSMISFKVTLQPNEVDIIIPKEMRKLRLREVE